MSKQSTSTPESHRQGLTQSVTSILNKPTSDVVNDRTQEAVAVASFAIEESKTVGGFGATILTVCALIAASPWSWIAALLFGPVRVWAFTYSLVIGGIGSVIALLVTLLLLLGVALIVIVGALVL
jgi:hypothetical protein